MAEFQNNYTATGAAGARPLPAGNARPSPVRGAASQPPPPVPGYTWIFKGPPAGLAGPNAQGVWEATAPGENDRWSGVKAAGEAGRAAGETFADAATGGGYSSVIAPTLGYDSQSYAAGLIEDTGIGNINRKAAETAAGVYGVDLNVPTPGQSAGAGGPGGMGGPGQFGQGEFDEWSDRAGFTYGEALDASQASYTPGAIRDPSAIRAPEIRDPSLGPTERVTASGPAATQGYSAALIDRTNVMPAAGQAGVSRIDAADVQRAVAQPADTAVFGGVGKAAFDTNPQAGVRADQLGDAQLIRDLATGRGPMAGRDTYGAALGRLSDEQMAIANAASGEDKAAARVEAIQQIGRQGLIAAREGAAMDAQAQQQATQGLTSATQGIRATDVDLSGQMARLDQERQNLAAQLETAVRQGNRDAINQIKSQQAAIDAERNQLQATITQGAREFNAGAQNVSALDYARRLDATAAQQAGIDAERATTQALSTNQAQQFGAGAANTSALDYSQRLDAAGTTNAGASNKRAADEAALKLQRDTAAGAQSIQAQTTTNDQGVSADVARNDAGQAAFTGNSNARLGGLAAANAATGAGIDAVSGKVDAVTSANKTAMELRAEQDKRDAAQREGYRTLINEGVELYGATQKRKTA